MQAPVSENTFQFNQLLATIGRSHLVFIKRYCQNKMQPNNAQQLSTQNAGGAGTSTNNLGASFGRSSRQRNASNQRTPSNNTPTPDVRRGTRNLVGRKNAKVLSKPDPSSGELGDKETQIIETQLQQRESDLAERIERERIRGKEMRLKVEAMLHTAEYEMHDRNRARAADELAWLEFETRIRHMMQNILTPIVQMVGEEREAMFDVELKQNQIDRKLDMLDRAVFRENSENGRTIFDDMEDGMSELSVQLTESITEMRDLNSETKNKMETRMTSQDQRFEQFDKLSGRLDLTVQNVEQIQKANRDFVHSITHTIADQRSEQLDHFKSEQAQTKTLFQRSESLTNGLSGTLERVATLEKQMERARTEIDQHSGQLTTIAETKAKRIDVDEFKKNIDASMKKLKLRVDEIFNQEVSLESWIEKYLPLRMHTLVCEMMEDFIDDEMRIRWQQVSRVMAAQLRKEILDDHGYSKLKQKALDLITTLRLTEKVLNDQKTEARNQQANRKGPAIKHVTEEKSHHHALSSIKDKLKTDMELQRIDQLVGSSSSKSSSRKELSKSSPRKKEQESSSVGVRRKETILTAEQSQTLAEIEKQVNPQVQELEGKRFVQAGTIRFRNEYELPGSTHSIGPENTEVLGALAGMGPPLQKSHRLETADLDSELNLDSEQEKLRRDLMAYVDCAQKSAHTENKLLRQELELHVKNQFLAYESKIGGLLEETQRSLTDVRLETDQFQAGIRRGQGQILTLQKQLADTLSRLQTDKDRHEGELQVLRFASDRLFDACLSFERLFDVHLGGIGGQCLSQVSQRVGGSAFQLTVQKEARYVTSTENKLVQNRKEDSELVFLQSAYDALRRIKAGKQGAIASGAGRRNANQLHHSHDPKSRKDLPSIDDLDIGAFSVASQAANTNQKERQKTTQTLLLDLLDTSPNSRLGVSKADHLLNLSNYTTRSMGAGGPEEVLLKKATSKLKRSVLGPSSQLKTPWSIAALPTEQQSPVHRKRYLNQMSAFGLNDVQQSPTKRTRDTSTIASTSRLNPGTSSMRHNQGPIKGLSVSRVEEKPQQPQQHRMLLQGGLNSRSNKSPILAVLGSHTTPLDSNNPNINQEAANNAISSVEATSHLERKDGYSGLQSGTSLLQMTDTRSPLPALNESLPYQGSSENVGTDSTLLQQQSSQEMKLPALLRYQSQDSVVISPVSGQGLTELHDKNAQ